jgi:hypothetical protein
VDLLHSNVSWNRTYCLLLIYHSTTGKLIGNISKILLTYTTPDDVAPQNRNIFINTAGNLFNVAMCIAFTAESTHMVCYLPWPSATWQLRQTRQPEGIGFFKLTQRYPVQNCVFSLSMPLCLVRNFIHHAIWNITLHFSSDLDCTRLIQMVIIIKITNKMHYID